MPASAVSATGLAPEPYVPHGAVKYSESARRGHSGRARVDGQRTRFSGRPRASELIEQDWVWEQAEKSEAEK